MDLLSRADAATIQSSLRVVSALPPLDGCADAKALREPVPLPRDHEKRAELDALSSQLHEPLALLSAGKYEQAEAKTQPIVRRLEAIGYLPLLSRARCWWRQALGML